ncbi:hypothetical protein [Rhodococcus sp. WB9]|uniref:hypothetical protein n=1 Tax=Rhodococcus sp. WB9 TaxID=2594007 RepID=UPI0016431593|nr:hypothetical protein [Rhodococcus sp. WB9]
MGLAEAVEKTVTRRRADLRLPAEDAENVDVVNVDVVTAGSTRSSTLRASRSTAGSSLEPASGMQLSGS